MPSMRAAHAVEHAGRHVAGNDRIGDARQPAVPEVNVGTAHLGAAPSAAAPHPGEDPGRRIRARRSAACGAVHDRGKDAVAHVGTLPLDHRSGSCQQADQLTIQLESQCCYRALFVALSIVAVISPASAFAQPYSDAKPRRQFVTISSIG